MPRDCDLPHFGACARAARHAACALWLLAGLPAQAGITLSVGSTTAVAGSTGNAVEVLLTNTGADPVDVAAFSFELGATSPALAYTGADTAGTGAPYIFAGHSAFGPVISTATGASLQASDLFDVAGGAATVGAGATVQLGRVLFDVGADAGAGAVQLVLSGFPATSLSGVDLGGGGSDIPVASAVAGVVSVASAVPEPGTLALLLAGALLVHRKAGRRRASRA